MGWVDCQIAREPYSLLSPAFARMGCDLLKPPLNRRAYDPANYAHLNVSAEIKDLFQYIGRYKAHEVDLDTSLRCFVPDYIPAVGDMDAFLKVPRPDKAPDELGFKASLA